MATVFIFLGLFIQRLPPREPALIRRGLSRALTRAHGRKLSRMPFPVQPAQHSLFIPPTGSVDGDILYLAL